MIVSAVFEDTPSRSHLNIDAVVNIEKNLSIINLDSWTDSGIFSYVKLGDKINISELEKKLNKLAFENSSVTWEKIGWHSVYSLMPIKNIRLYSNRIGDTGGNSIGHIIALVIITLIIIVLAIINYTNLSVALVNKRSHEVGMRIIAGSSRWYIFTQFLCESILHSLAALIISLPMVEIFIIPFGNLTGLPLEFSVVNDFTTTLVFIGFSVALGLISGFYPAFIMSGFNPISSVKKSISKAKNKAQLRSSLIVVQFAAGIALIIITYFVYHQRGFINDYDLGFDKANTLIASTRNVDSSTSKLILKNEIERLNGVVKVSLANSKPPESFAASNFIPEGTENTSMLLIPSMHGDADFCQTLGLELVEGRFFNTGSVTDKESIIINQKLAKQLGWEQAVGKRLLRTKKDAQYWLTIIGVVKDFHFESLYSPVNPLVIKYDDSANNYLIARLNPDSKSETLELIINEWKNITSEEELNYQFIADNYDKLYESEKSMSKAFMLLTIVALTIAIIGLVGLATFSVSQRVKEISIRKVLGANTQRILVLLWWNYLKLILISSLIAWPIAYYITNSWLNGFTARVEITPWAFVLSTLLSIAVAILSVGVLTYKVSINNPIKSLRYE